MRSTTYLRDLVIQPINAFRNHLPPSRYSGVVDYSLESSSDICRFSSSRSYEKAGWLGTKRGDRNIETEQILEAQLLNYTHTKTHPVHVKGAHIIAFCALVHFAVSLFLSPAWVPYFKIHWPVRTLSRNHGLTTRISAYLVFGN